VGKVVSVMQGSGLMKAARVTPAVNFDDPPRTTALTPGTVFSESIALSKMQFIPFVKSALPHFRLNKIITAVNHPLHWLVSSWKIFGDTVSPILEKFCSYLLYALIALRSISVLDDIG
jgi:hypothetical protein